MKNFLRFIRSRVFLKNLGLAILITLFVSVSVFVFLRIYTRHGQALSVPNLKGYSIEECDSILRERNLRYQIIDSVYNSLVPRGSVVSQNPKPAFKVKENRRIFLTINAFNPEVIAMPELVGVSLRQAGAILETAGLRIGKLTYVPDIAVNNVLQQKHKGSVIEVGDSIIKGSEIDLVLGMGHSNERTAAPDLTGVLLEDARDMMTRRYLNLGAVIYDGSILDGIDSANAFIWKQRPEYDEEDEILINLGSTVDVWLTVDSTKLPVPEDLNGMETDEQAE